MLIAAISAAAPVLGWAIVGDAIDNGIKACERDAPHASTWCSTSRVGATAWILGTTTWLMLAGVGQQIVLDLRRDLFDHLTSLSLRYFSQQKAGWIIARLTSDVDAHLRRPQPGADDARRQLADAPRRDRRPVPARLAPRRRGADRAAARDRRHALVPDGLAHRVRRRAHPDRGRDRAARRVGRGHGRRPGVQPRAGVPARVRRPQRGEPDLERLRAEALVHLLPRDRVPRRDRDRRRAVRRRQADRRRLARDRDADRRDRHAAARLPAAPGALGALRAGAGRERRDDEDLDRARRRAGHHRPPGRARDRAHRGPPPARQRRLRVRRGAGDPRHLDRRARGRLHRARRRVGRRQVDDREADRALLRPARGRGAHRRHRPARRAAAVDPPPARRRPPGSVPVQRHDRRQHPLRRGPRRPTRRSRQPRRRSASTGSPPDSRTGSTTSSARAARASRPASVSSSRSRGRCSPTRAS